MDRRLGSRIQGQHSCTVTASGGVRKRVENTGRWQSSQGTYCPAVTTTGLCYPCLQVLVTLRAADYAAPMPSVGHDGERTLGESVWSHSVTGQRQPSHVNDQCSLECLFCKCGVIMPSLCVPRWLSSPMLPHAQGCPQDHQAPETPSGLPSPPLGSFPSYHITQILPLF